MITWNLNEPEADFILATLNGQPQNWTVMARAELIQKLMQQAQQKIPQVGEQTKDVDLLNGSSYGGTAQDGKPM